MPTERTHRTLKAEATRPAARTREAQQRAFNRFRRIYSEECPHEALDLQPPAKVYSPSTKGMPERLKAISYPEPFETRRVNTPGQIRWAKPTVPRERGPTRPNPRSRLPGLRGFGISTLARAESRSR